MIEQPAMPRRTSRQWAFLTNGGMIAGALAGFVLVIYLMVRNAFAGSNLWHPLKLASVPFFGQDVLYERFNAAAVAVGFGVHLGVSMVWGIFFAALVYGVNRAATIPIGGLFGMVVWFVMHQLVLPLFDISPAVASPAGTMLDHMLYGLLLGLFFVPFQRNVPVFEGDRMSDAPESHWGRLGPRSSNGPSSL